ncbi:hypothetical protein PMAYCL1PPCAC_28255, partial [Pristionchus mayeri]
DLEDTSMCTCTPCPPPDRLEQFDYCCKSLFIFPLRKKGQMLRDGLKEKLDQSESTPCICLQSYVKDFLLTDAAAQAAVSLRNYESGTVEEDENRNVKRREQWVKSICQTTSQEKELYRRLNSTVTPYICSSHFSPSDYDHPNNYTSIIRANAVP